MPDHTPSTDPAALLTHRFSLAIARAFPSAAETDPLVVPNKNPKLGDFQCNAAMGLAKRVGKPPREVAKALAEAVELADLCEPLADADIAGPGFINLRLKASALAGILAHFRPASAGTTPNPGTTVVDLCGVNLAKEMHVGHLRSTIIGDALARTFQRLGHAVVRQNHLGDWGLPIAMVTHKVMDESSAGRLDLANLRLADLDRLYKAAQKQCAPPPGFELVATSLAPFVTSKLHAEIADDLEQAQAAARHLADAKQTLIRLQRKDADVVRVWQRIVDVTIAACAENCAKLNAIVLPEHTAGESSYADELATLVDDLLRRGIAEIDDGAAVVRLDRPEFGNIKEPCLIRKGDGGFLYATTDLAAIRRRVQSFKADRVVYCVDARQSLHFRQVFAAAHRAGFTTRPDGTIATLAHAAFGTVLGEDGKPFKTRSGENVKLADLIDEATQRAAAQMRERQADVPPDAFERTAWSVGVAAIKYADLSIERVKDYVFSFDRMVAFEGNTGPYLLYAGARVRSIFRKAGLDPNVFRDVPLVLEHPEERALALAILRYPAALAAVGEHAEPHRLCQFLYDLAGAFSSFYAAHRVIDAPEPVRASRLRLCLLTSETLEDGLTCLGIPVVERM